MLRRCWYIGILLVAACGTGGTPIAVPKEAGSATPGSTVATATVRPSAAAVCNGLPYRCAQLVELGFTYPFARLPDSYLFVDGATYPYVKITNDLLDDSVVAQPDGTTTTVRDLLSALGIAGSFDRALRPVIGYGSNPAPAQLFRKFVHEKFAGHAVIPTLKGVLTDYDVVWSPHFVSYGAIPATLVRAPGTRVEVWVNWLNEAAIEQMNGTEGAGTLYAYGRLDGIELELPGPKATPLTVYIDCYGALVIDGRLQALSSVPARGRTANSIDEANVLHALMSRLKWTGSAFDLLLANVTSTAGRAQRTEAIAPLGHHVPDPNFTPEVGCSRNPSARTINVF